MPPVSSRTIMKSRPSTTERFRLEASANGWKHSAGRRLANTPIPARKASRPASGRLSRGAPAHCGPPTAPISTALAAFAAARVSSVSGTPCWSKLIPPNARSSTARPGASLPATRRTCAVTSGPIPSPGRSSRSVIWKALELERAFGSRLVGEEPAVGNPELRPVAAPGRHVRRLEVRIERGLVAPGLENPHQPRFSDVYGVGIFLTAVLGAAGGQHRLHVRPEPLQVLRRHAHRARDDQGHASSSQGL